VTIYERSQVQWCARTYITIRKEPKRGAKIVQISSYIDFVDVVT